MAWPIWATQTALALSFACAVLGIAQWRSTPAQTEAKSSEFKAFQRQYLAVYLTIMLADWLQGTNMYTLYSGYGMNVGMLFITGFGSSAFFGTFVGLLVDRYGRKKGCVLFCILEIVINVLEHVPNMPALLFGRVLGGISTSLLFSAFESWMVSEHRRRGYPEGWLEHTFSLASIGNGIVAIAAGLLAQVAADIQGDIGPFQLAIALTVLTLALVRGWRENYGAAHAPPAASASPKSKAAAKAADAELSVLGGAGEACALVGGAMRSDPRIVVLGAALALFEGAMYTFVFMWVPTLLRLCPASSLSGEAFPIGIVFSCFMACITLGGMLFGTATALGLDAAPFSVGVGLVAAATMVVPVVTDGFVPVFVSFLLVEVCVGAFQACAGTLRSRVIPDAIQSSVMNVIRVPLSLLTVAGTYLSDHAAPATVFMSVGAWFGASALLHLVLLFMKPPKAKGGKAN